MVCGFWVLFILFFEFPLPKTRRAACESLGNNKVGLNGRVAVRTIGQRQKKNQSNATVREQRLCVKAGDGKGTRRDVYRSINEQLKNNSQFPFLVYLLALQLCPASLFHGLFSCASGGFPFFFLWKMFFFFYLLLVQDPKRTVARVRDPVSAEKLHVCQVIVK